MTARERTVPSTLFSEEELEEFLAIAHREGVEVSREEAVATATRVILLYLRLALPTPAELADSRLAKRWESGTLSTVDQTNQSPQ